MFRNLTYYILTYTDVTSIKIILVVLFENNAKRKFLTNSSLTLSIVVSQMNLKITEALIKVFEEPF